MGEGEAVSEDRLARIENKVDQLTEVVVTLAQHDERITNLSKSLDRSEVRLDAVESKAERNSIITSGAQWVVMVLLGSAATLFIKSFAG